MNILSVFLGLTFYGFHCAWLVPGTGAALTLCNSFFGLVLLPAAAGLLPPLGNPGTFIGDESPPIGSVPSRIAFSSSRVVY